MTFEQAFDAAARMIFEQVFIVYCIGEAQRWMARACARAGAWRVALHLGAGPAHAALAGAGHRCSVVLVVQRGDAQHGVRPSDFHDPRSPPPLAPHRLRACSSGPSGAA